jgi:hypothetical protein
MESRVPCVINTGIRTSGSFASVSNSCVRMRPTGRNPHALWSIMSRTEVKVASSTRPEASGRRRGELGGDGAAERVPDDVARAPGRDLREVIPRGLGILVGVGLGRRDVAALAEAAVVDREHAKPSWRQRSMRVTLPVRFQRAPCRYSTTGRVGTRAVEPPGVQLVPSPDWGSSDRRRSSRSAL